MLKMQPFINQINQSKTLKESQKESAITALMRIENNGGANFCLDSDVEFLTEAFLWEITMEGPVFWKLIHDTLVK